MSHLCISQSRRYDEASDLELIDSIRHHRPTALLTFMIQQSIPCSIDGRYPLPPHDVACSSTLVVVLVGLLRAEGRSTGLAHTSQSRAEHGRGMKRR